MTKCFQKAEFMLVCLLCVATAATHVANSQDATRVIQIHAKRFSFSPSEITVKKGETVKLILFSDDVTHALVIPDLHVKREVSKGHPAEVTFVADEVGDFYGKCGHFCGSGHGSMTFTVHVKGN